MSSIAEPPKVLASDRVIINSAMSFAGAAQRTMRIRERTGPGWPRGLITVFLCLPILTVWFVLIVAWYTVTIGLFGIVTIPYRILRRGARKRKAESLRHAEVLSALERTRQP